MTEPDYGWGPECIHLSAKSENGKYLLGGTKRFIQDASEAFLECGHLAHEVHAGLGVDKKYPLYLYSKSSKTLYYIHIWGIPTITANESPGYWGFN
jgi:hypothetical protein